MAYLTEPERRLPVAFDVDVCVVGGSCTGVFAAVRAARLGRTVALIEKRSMLGGMATAAQVTHWHSTYDIAGKHRIIGGLLDEVVARLRDKNAIVEMPPGGRLQYRFNAAVLASELDTLVTENRIKLFLESVCSQPIMAGGRIEGVAIEDCSGRRAIRASVFVDASGDGVLLRRAGFDAVKGSVLQPVSYQVLVAGIDQVRQQNPKVDIWQEVRKLADKHTFPNSNPWIDPVPGIPGVCNIFGARLNAVDASNPDQLTRAYVEGRRCANAYLQMICERFPNAADAIALVSLAQAMGVRETWHASCLHQLTRDEILGGTQFEDTIANGTYPIDIHGPEGTVLKYLDGRESFKPNGGDLVWRRWRDKRAPSPMSYHIPLRCLIPKSAENLLVAGRLVDADRDAFGAIRVMVNCNQTGEAAGAAAALCVEEDCDVASVDARRVREALVKGGSLLENSSSNKPDAGDAWQRA
jgi:2-polyprenyl-6-methoxyphenol hydroxylase-like FAD-dependent oxidoreductase